MTSLANAELSSELPLRLRISAEFFCDPVWVTGQGVMEDTDGSALGFSNELVQDLREWSEAYNATYNDDDPQEGGPLPADHFVRGFELARRIRQVTPSAWTVIAQDPDSGHEVEVPIGSDPRDSSATCATDGGL
ncbi:hypothetical protein [Leifsonia sp. Leaf336]|uniref:hypothetical protein n=1 Tax=Leifsonia sp. Leaf336 TaxID=1736341 RepID=UPI0012FC0FF3|nr:hypothetical protein [Leifsonia sp. Leaf336]